ncbi:hypothetical protein CPC08DRAFT_650697 [Agrocybe pediades]|nr:hypothetical protein CPC08DRAFT_650697 [Agrocybe pediades]
MRLAGYEFSKADYEAYFQETESLLAKEGVARRALKTGGIVWRLAVGESFSRVLEANWSHSHSSTIYVSGDGSEYFDEKCTVEEMDAICGVYLCPQVTKAEILEKSWWPTDKIWKKYAAYPYWSDFHEFWFRNRSEAIKNGQAQPLSQHDHKKMIRKNGKLNRMEKKIEENSLHFFDHINEGGLTYRV